MESPLSGTVDAERPPSGASAPRLVVWFGGSERTLPPGPSYLVGRDPAGNLVTSDARVSWHHAVLRIEGSRWVLSDSGSTNGVAAMGMFAFAASCAALTR